MQKYIISSRNEKKKERKPVFETFFCTTGDVSSFFLIFGEK